MPLKLSAPALKPRPAAATSIPGMLSLLQNEWDALMLELHSTKTQLETTRQELGHALYQHDAACRVIARLMKERDDARNALVNAKPAPITAPTTAAAAPPAAGAAVGAGGVESGLSPQIVAQFEAKNKELSKGRKKRSLEGFAAAAEVAALTKTISSSLHQSGRVTVACHTSLPTVATGGEDGLIQIYDADSNKPVQQIKGGAGRVRRVLLHPTRPFLLSGGEDGAPRLWSTEAGEIVHTYENGHAAEVSGISLQATGDFFVSAALDHSWCMWDLARPSSTPILCVRDAAAAKGTSGYFCASVHPDGLILATGVKGAVKLWDVKSQANVASFDSHEGDVGCLSFSENGFYLATGDATTVRLWDLRKLKMFKTLDAPAAIADVAFDFSGQFLAFGAGGEVAVHEAKTWSGLTKFEVGASGIAWGPFSKTIAVGSTDGKLQMYGGP